MFRILAVAVLTCILAMFLAVEAFKVFQEGGHPDTGLVAALLVLAFGGLIALGNAAASIVERMDRQEARAR